MTNDSLAVLLMTNRLVDVDADALTAREIWGLYDKIPQIGQVLEVSADELVSDYAIEFDEAERIKKLCDAATAFVFEMKRLEDSGIRILSFLDEGFPKRVSHLRFCWSQAILTY